MLKVWKIIWQDLPLTIMGKIISSSSTSKNSNLKNNNTNIKKLTRIVTITSSVKGEEGERQLFKYLLRNNTGTCGCMAPPDIPR